MTTTTTSLPITWVVEDVEIERREEGGEHIVETSRCSWCNCFTRHNIQRQQRKITSQRVWASRGGTFKYGFRTREWVGLWSTRSNVACRRGGADLSLANKMRNKEILTCKDLELISCLTSLLDRSLVVTGFIARLRSCRWSKQRGRFSWSAKRFEITSHHTSIMSVGYYILYDALISSG